MDNLNTFKFSLVDQVSASGPNCGGDGGRRGTGPQCSSDCRSCNGDCGWGTCGNANCAEASTPFLYMRTKNGFEMDNDVMFGKPISYFTTLEEGIVAHQAGKVKPDLYLVQKEVAVIEGKVQFQIKEIEPEVSAISSVTLYRVPVKMDKTLVTLSDFSGCVRFDDAVSYNRDKNLKCYNMQQKDVTDQLLYVADSKKTKNSPAITLETAEYIDVEFETNTNEDHYLLLQSWYRDWALGDIYSVAGAFDTTTVSPYKRFLSASRAKTARGLVSGFIATVMGYLGFVGNFAPTTDEANLLSSKFGFGAMTARAENPNCTRNPKSLELSYVQNDQKTTYEITNPRYTRPSTVAVRVPSECILNGKGKIRITATKKHKVSGISIVKGVSVLREQLEVLPLVSAYHHRDKKDYKDVFDSNQNSITGNYVRTSASDVVTFTFDAKSNESEVAYDYLVSVSGVYAFASKEEQLKMGDWTKKLDDEALAFLSEVYYQSDSAKKV